MCFSGLLRCKNGDCCPSGTECLVGGGCSSESDSDDSTTPIGSATSTGTPIPTTIGGQVADQIADSPKPTSGAGMSLREDVGRSFILIAAGWGVMLL